MVLEHMYRFAIDGGDDVTGEHLACPRCGLQKDHVGVPKASSSLYLEL
jgi:hypothetical protein